MSNIRSSAGLPAIVRKELRDGVKWCALGLIGMSLAYTYALHQQSLAAQYNDFGNYDSSSILSSQFVTLNTFGCAIVGLMLGLAQTMPENRGDKWGFLVHRPVSRSVIFCGKVIAGLLLYAIAVGVPLAASVGWLATPGHLPFPFDARMALPSLADSLCGAVYYFAALMIGLREARWFGSRVMSVGVGLICSIAVVAVPEFWQAVVAIAIALLIIVPAAWGTFIRGGRYDTQPLAGRFTTGISVGLGVVIACGVAFGAITSILLSGPNRYPPRKTYAVARDGTLVQEIEDEGYALADAVIQDLDGQPAERFKNVNPRDITSGVVTASVDLNYSPTAQAADGYRQSDRWYVPVNPDDDYYAPLHWIYIRQEQLLAAYDAHTRQIAGWMGPDGFAPGATPPAHRFNSAWLATEMRYGSDLLTFPDAVYRLNLKARQLTKIFTPQAGESVMGAKPTSGSTELVVAFGRRAQFDAIVTTRSIHILSRDGHTVLTAPLDPTAQGYGDISISEPLQTKEPTFFLGYYPYGGLVSPSQWYTSPVQYSQYSADNTQVAHYTLPPPAFLPAPEWSDVVPPSVLLSVPMQGAIKLIERWTDRSNFQNEPPASWQVWAWALSTLASLVAATVAFGWAKKYAFSSKRTLAWAAIGFLLGPLAILLMWSLLDWPTRERCPSCGKLRVATKDRCEHCGQPFTAPATDGTEIFEPVAA